MTSAVLRPQTLPLSTSLGLIWSLVVQPFPFKPPRASSMDRPLGTSLNPTNSQHWCWREFTLAQGITQTLGDLRFGKLHLALGLNSNSAIASFLSPAGKTPCTSLTRPMTELTVSNPAPPPPSCTSNGDTVADVTYGKDEGGKACPGCLL